MKWIYRFVTITIIFGAVALPFLVDNQNGQPMLSLPSIPIPGLQQAQTKNSSTHVHEHTDLSPSANKTTTAYKWQDENGNWHYGDMPPPGHQGIEMLNIRNDVNLVQGLRQQESDEAEGDEKKDAAQQAAEKMTSGDEDLLSFERAQNIMKDAKLAAEAMSARNEQLGRTLGER